MNSIFVPGPILIVAGMAMSLMDKIRAFSKCRIEN